MKYLFPIFFVWQLDFIVDFSYFPGNYMWSLQFARNFLLLFGSNNNTLFPSCWFNSLAFFCSTLPVSHASIVHFVVLLLVLLSSFLSVCSHKSSGYLVT